MDTTEILLTVLTVLLSIFIIAGIVLVVGLIKLIGLLRQLVLKAEDIVGNVESAAEIFRDTQGRLALFKLIRNVIKLVKKGLK